MLVPALFMFVLAADGTNVVETLLVTQVLGGNGTVYGVLGVFFAAGAVIGPLLAARVESDRVRVLAVVGVAGGGLNALCLTLVVTRTPDAFRGRVLATVTGGARAASLLALVIGGLLGQSLGPRHTYVALGVLTLAAAPMALLGLRGLREPRAV
ncbi:MAG TPA: MFS transporter [Candidatus Lustribacter sp.]|nr:MFS transporter [Candidatus Lustribacter sp.]